MANVGMDFKAPKMTAVKAWEIVRGMYKLGHAFQTCGCDGPGFIPSSESEYAEYLLKRRNLYRDMLNSRTGEQEPNELEQYINYWNGKLRAIEVSHSHQSILMSLFRNPTLGVMSLSYSPFS